MFSHQGRSEAELNERDRCSDRSIHNVWLSSIHTVGQGPEFIAQAVRDWICGCWSKDSLHRTRQPLGEWILLEFNGRLRDKLLKGEIFYSLRETQIIIEK